MDLRSNTILITGGSSGIGRGLAEAFFRLGNRVIVAGRHEDAIKRVAAEKPGMDDVVLDVTDPASIRAAAADLITRFPDLNVVINNAGIQRPHDFSAPQSLDEQSALDEINTNLLGVIRCTAAFLPHLKTRTRATIINVSSGLAFVPLARFPVYCATKAAVHSFTVSLRHQLKETNVRVLELIPPYVATALGRTSPPHRGPAPMPLGSFIAEAMKELATDREELAVAEAKRLHAAATSDAATMAFERMNGS